MFVLRALFWLAFVALLMPRGPDLGLDVTRVRTDLAAHPSPLVLVDDLRGGLVHVRTTALDPVQITIGRYRDALLDRLNGVRAELVSARPQARDNALISLEKMGIR